MALMASAVLAHADTITHPVVATKEKQGRDRVTEMIANQDGAALEEFVRSGQGIFLDEGTQIIPIKGFTMWQIRVRGSSQLWWIRADDFQSGS
jgi:hypothetical protein